MVRVMGDGRGPGRRLHVRHQAVRLLTQLVKLLEDRAEEVGDVQPEQPA